MLIAYWIFVGYAIIGFLYAPSLDSLTALAFIAFSCSPLLLARGAPDDRGLRVPPPSFVVYWLTIGLGVLNLVVIARRVGQGATDITSVGGSVAIATLSTGARYGAAAASGSPLLVAFSLWLIFRMGASSGEVSRIKQVLAWLPILAYSALTTEKWIVALGGIFFFSALMVAKPPRQAVKKSAAWALGLSPAVIMLSIWSLLLRGRTGGIDALLREMAAYVFMQYTTFGAWLTSQGFEACCSWGTSTFIGPLSALGVVERPPGVFTTSFIVEGYETNIFTAFRYVVEDFSIVGPLVLACGAAGLYLSFQRLGASTLRRPLAAFVTFAALMSFNTTPFVHNSVAFALSLSMLTVLMAGRRHLRDDATYTPIRLRKPSSPDTLSSRQALGTMNLEWGSVERG